MVPYLERLDRCEELQNDVASLQQRTNLLDQTCAALHLEIKQERDRGQQYFNSSEDKNREIAELRMALREINDENQRERQRHHVVLARLRASVCFVPTESTCPFLVVFTA
jgi:chromosome segregation ATPase